MKEAYLVVARPSGVAAICKPIGEVVTLDNEGRQSFSALQNYGSSNVPLVVPFRDVCNDDEELSQEWFTNRKVQHIMLTVLTDNRDPRAIYEAWGFFDFVSTMWKSVDA